MEFDTEDHAYRFYNLYAGFVGFSIRKDWRNKSKLDNETVMSRKFVCFKEGFERIKEYDEKVSRKDIRTGCLAHVVISRESSGKYVVTSFRKDHNHELASPRSKHKLPSQRRVSAAQAAEVEMANRSGIRQKLIFEFMSQHVGGRENVGCTSKDISNHLTAKRMKEMKEGEAYTLLHYFKAKQTENQSFFYDIQLDVDNQITNIFWADAKMVLDYVYFGDVVCFDTTYRTNKNLRPFAPFIGFNHHRESVIFGAALLYDETAASFEWLFKTFLKAMCGKKPKTIFTDQDAAMAKAISEVFPESETYHRLCLWHLFQNALKNLNHAFQRSDSFAMDLRSCIYDFEYEDDFLAAWNSLLEKHDLHQNKWMQDLYKEKEKWALVYGRNTFSAGATTTQLSESFNGRLRLYMKSTYNVLEFFTHLERLINDMRYKEIESKYEMSQKMPALNMDIMLLKTARDIYTPVIFSLVRGEYEKSCNLLLNNCSKNLQLYEYVVSFFRDMRQHKVTFNSEDQSVECSCRLFQFIGILCCHALRVLNHPNIIVIPQKYILKRWTKQARSGCVLDSKGQIIKEDPKIVVANRFKDLCRTAVGISSKAAEDGDASAVLARKLMEASIEVDKILSKRSSTSTTNLGEVNSRTNEIVTDDITTVSKAMGIKKKDGKSRIKGRPKSCVEKKYKRSKGTHKRSHVTQNYSTIMPIMQVLHNSNSYFFV
jgi:zinc finger SWIM domain-containing protein 3